MKLKNILSLSLILTLNLQACKDTESKNPEFLDVFKGDSGLVNKEAIDESNKNEKEELEEVISESEVQKVEQEENALDSSDEESEEGIKSIESSKPSLEDKNSRRSKQRQARKPRQAAQKTRFRSIRKGPFISLPFTDQKIISICETPNEDLYFAERYRIFMLSKDEAWRTAHEVLNSDSFKSDTQESMPAINTIDCLAEQGIWVGFTNGMLAHNGRKNWEITRGGPEFTKNRINVISQLNKDPFIGGRGLFQWDESFKRFLTVSEAKGLTIKDIARSSDTKLFIASRNAVHTLEFPDKSMNEFFRLFKEDIPIEDIHLEDSNLLLGTSQGILALTKERYPLFRIAGNTPIKIISPLNSSSGFLVSKDGELLSFQDKKVTRLVDSSFDKVENIYTSSNKIVWVSLESGILFKAQAKKVLNWFDDNQKKNELDYSESFTNACEAAEKLLTKSRYSGDISTSLVDGTLRVFLKGEQICPFKKGLMRADGLSIQVEGWDLLINRRDQRQPLSIDPKIPANLMTKIVIDSKDRIFIGTQKGLYIHEENKWRHVTETKELKEDYISDIIEDVKGNVWISSRIQIAPGQDETPEEYKPLHVLTKDGWAHFGTKEGFESFGISDIELDKKDLLLSSSRGIARLTSKAEVNFQGSPEGLSRYIVESLTHDKNETLWISHGYFLSGITWIKGKKMFIATKSNGLFSDRISSIGVDDEDRIWLIDTGGRVGVYSENVLEKMAVQKKIDTRRVRKRQLLN